MIEFRHVFKRYATGLDALKGISFEIDSDEMVFLTGHSGAGKSTLLRLITLVERATRGSVTVNGADLMKLPKRRIPHHRRGIGVVYQDHKLLNDRTVFDNVALPLIVSGVPHGELSRRVRAALDKVNLLGKERMYPLALSGGEQQRVGIARAVVNRPPILLADEPTGNLDPELSEEIMDLFYMFNQHNVTVLIATHDLQLLARYGKRVLQLYEGQLIDGFKYHPQQ